MATNNLSAYAWVGESLRGSQFVLIDAGEVVESVENRQGNIDQFAEHLAGYIKILGIDPARVYVKCWGGGMVLLRTMEKTYGLKLSSIKGSDAMRRADMEVIGKAYG